MLSIYTGEVYDPLMTVEVIDRFKGPYYFLSNFYPSVIVLHDEVLGREVVVASVEHGYQADRTLAPAWRTRILAAGSGGEAKHLGKIVIDRPGWKEMKVERMLFWLRRKFEIPGLRERLLSTDEAQLIEGNPWKDRFWGVYQGVGENHLGKLLMQVRDEVRRAP